MPEVSIVILNWNGKDWLKQFLPSVSDTEYPDYEIVVVDNASTDDSVDFVGENFPTVRLIRLEENYGFAEGYNRCLEYIDAPYMVLLNSDVEVTPGWLTPLMERIKTDERIAAVQPKVMAYNSKETFEYVGAAGGYIDRFGYPFCRGRMFEVCEIDEGQYDTAVEIFWATGACCLVRKSVIDEIGLFESSFFAHMEEIDFCWRARNFGYTIWCEPKSVVYHVGGGTLSYNSPRKTFLNVRNNLSMMYKNLPGWKRWGKVFSRLVLDGIWGIKSLLRWDLPTLTQIVRGHMHFHKRLFYWEERRKEIYGDRLPNTTKGPGYYEKSVVWQFYALGKKRFSEIKWK